MTAAALPPGPRLPGAAQAVLWGLRFPEFTATARQRFGPTYTVCPGTMDPLVVTSDPDAVRFLLTGDPLERRNGNDEVVRPLIGDRSVLVLEPAEHLERRRLLLPRFHGERVRGYAELMQRLMDEAVDRWSPGRTVAVLPIAQNVTIEVILQAVLGVGDPELRKRFRRLIDDLLFYPFGAARLRASGRFTPGFALPRRVREATAFAGSLFTPAVSTYFTALKTRTWRNPGTWAWWRYRDRLIDLLDEHIADTRADPGRGERDDVLAMLVQESLTSEDLRDDLITLIGAGHETTAAAIAWGATLLAHNPEVRERARSGDGEYLGALVKEVLRVRSPLPLAATRILPAPLTIGRHTVPAGTVIAIDAWGLHNDPERHADPRAFRPERFLGDAPEAYSWLPFGGGAHRCLGAAMAELEMKIALDTMLRRVDLLPVDRELPPVARRGLVMVPHGGGRVRIG
jgi:cytochrome P450 family 135